jgi:hypothetical protein
MDDWRLAIGTPPAEVPVSKPAPRKKRAARQSQFGNREFHL